MSRTWRTLLRLELRVQWRYGVLAAVATLAGAWVALLAALPSATARVAAPWVLLLDTALIGTTVVGALVILERQRGASAALTLSPVSWGPRLATKAGVLTAAVTVAAVPVVIAGRPPGAGALPALLAVATLTLLTVLLSVAVAAGRSSVLSFMATLPLVLVPLVAPAMLHLAGVSTPMLHLVPTVGATDVIMSAYADRVWSPWVLGWPLAACVWAGWWAHRRLRAAATGAPARVSHAPPTARAAATGRGRGPVRAIGLDLRTLARDPLLVMLGISPILLGLALRFGYPPVRDWLLATHGVELAAYRPLLLAVAVVVHVPVSFGMVGALLVLDDMDNRALAALRVSPLPVPGYLAYRAGLMVVAAAANLTVVLPLSGLVSPYGQPVLPLLAALLLTPLVMGATVAIARDKVTGAAVLKLLGPPLYAPVLAWWLGPWAGWFLWPLPTWWILQAQWTASWYALGGLVLSLVLLTLLVRRVTAVATA